MNEFKTYRELKLWLDRMTPKELDMTATINLTDQEEAYAVTGFHRVDFYDKNDHLNDVLDDGHPVIDVKI